MAGYIADPEASMRAFLSEHPDFIANALLAGGKDAERAKLCVDNNFYGAAVYLK